MNNAEFKAYKADLHGAIRKVLGAAPPRSLDEAGFPAYSHPNPVINWLFWQRLRRTMEYIERHAPYERALDFGCGSGVMLPFLGRLARQVVGLDADLSPFQRMQAHLNFPANLEVQEASNVNLEQWPAASFDLIIALDVLEHVENLPDTLTALLRLLRHDGRFIISGPTENIFYRMGRNLAGPEYSGAYHQRDIAEIKHQLVSRARIEHIATLYWPAPLFEIFAVNLRSRG